MSLDYFVGQKVVCVVKSVVFRDFTIVLRTQLPKWHGTYTVSCAVPCESCGCAGCRRGDVRIHISVAELPPVLYPAYFFRPTEPAAMKVLRRLLVTTPERVT